MEILEKVFAKLSFGKSPVPLTDERKVIKDVDEFLKRLSIESSKCLREEGKVILVNFKVPSLPDEKVEEFEEKLAKKFRVYDLVAALSPKVYAIGVVSLKPSNNGRGIGLTTILSRVKAALKEAGLDPESFVYSFKILPYDGTDPKVLLKMNLKELQRGEGEEKGREPLLRPTEA